METDSGYEKHMVLQKVSDFYLFIWDDERDNVYCLDGLAVTLADLMSHLCGSSLSHYVLLAATVITDRLIEIEADYVRKTKNIFIRIPSVAKYTQPACSLFGKVVNN